MDKAFVERIISMRKDTGKQWIDTIPQQIKKYEVLWGITVFSPFSLSYNYVAPAKTKDGKDVVFKICLPPADDEPFLEISALSYYDGHGVIKILQKDESTHTMLLERAIPGIPLRDQLATIDYVPIVAEIVNKMHKPLAGSATAVFPTLALWATDFSKYKEKFSLINGPIPKHMVDRAEEIFTQYPKDNKEKYVLHGDLHAANILSSKRGWLAIDPKGIIGEKEFELGIFFRSPLQDFPKSNNHKKIITDSAARFADLLHVDKKRIVDWAFATSVNGLVWFLEDHNIFKADYLENANLLSEIVS